MCREHRGDETCRHLPVSQMREPLVDFDELLKKLRAALSL